MMEWFFPADVLQSMHGGGDGIGEAGADNDQAKLAFERVGAWILGRNMRGRVRGPRPDESWKGWWGDEPPYHVPTGVDIDHQTKETLWISAGAGMRAALVKWLNSREVCMPKSFAEDVKVTEGSTVDLSMEDGRLVGRLASRPEYSLTELPGGITETNLHAEVGSREPVGGEEWWFHAAELSSACT